MCVGWACVCVCGPHVQKHCHLVSVCFTLSLCTLTAAYEVPSKYSGMPIFIPFTSKWCV